MTIGIIGGGVMGLVIGSKLSRQGYSVHVMESASQLGGLATWFDYNEFIWDKFYHVILANDQHILGLINELGLSKKVHWASTKTGFLWEGKYISMNNHWELLTFPALNLYQKVRLVAGILACQFLQNPDNLHRLKADKWLSKVFGKGVYNTIWDPLLESKFGSLKKEIPASIMYSTIMRYRSTRNSSSGKESMGYLSGGLKVLIERLREEIIDHGGKVSCNCLVTSITEEESFINVVTSKESFHFDKLINTLPTFMFQKIAPNISGLYAQQRKPHFLGVICLSLVLKEAFSPYYVTNLIDKGFPFTGIIEPSNVASLTEFKGKHLLMLPRYDVPTSTWFDKTDQQIKDIFIEKLESIYPNVRSIILESFVNRAKIVQALWIDSAPTNTQPRKSEDGRIWIVNSELAPGHALSNNGIIEIASNAVAEFTTAGFNAERASPFVPPFGK
jgi:protoporphyrinogen oxidase